MGQALCSPSNCHRGCSSADAAPCANLVGTNTDGDTCGAGTGPGCQTPGSGKLLYDVCDPDKDNDGVPGDLDCDDKNKNIHGAYHYEWDDDTGHHSYSIPAATEQCNDIDEDCNGIKEQHLVANGKVIDVQTGGALSGGKIEVDCGSTKITETSTFSPTGAWSIDYWFDSAMCTGSSQWKIKLVSPDPLCPDTNEQAYSYSINSCLTASNVDFEVTKKPPAGTVRATITWTANVDLDFHMYASSGAHLYYGSGGAGTGYTASVNDGGNLYTLDVDDQGSSTGYYNPGGIETITVPRKAGTSYDFAINDYSHRGGAGGNFGTYGLKMRVYYDNCNTYRPEDHGPMTFLNAPNMPAIGYITATDVALPDSCPGGGGCCSKYSYCCYPGTQPGPCPYVCSTLGGHDPDAATWAEHSCTPAE
jgi:hypothetical protein